jgi:hypothetical protein
MTNYVPEYEVLWHNGTTFAPIDDDFVKSIDLDMASEGDEQNPFFMGDTSSAEASVTLRSVSTFRVEAWEDRRFRIRKRLQGSQLRTVFEGVINNRNLHVKPDQVTFAATGYADLVKRTKAVSPLFYRRRGATRTTSSSQEDPSASGYGGGVINYALWQAGGRPWEQDFLYPAAKFYYSCDHALFVPEWTWLNGEDAWEECASVARACGGQLYQDHNGVVRFRSPFTPTQGLLGFSWNEGTYGDISEGRSTKVKIDKVRVPWSFRAVQPQQVLWELPEPVLIPAKGASSEFATYGYLDLAAFTPDLPVYAWDGFDGAGDARGISFLTEGDFQVTDLSNVPVTPRRNQAESKAVFFGVQELGAQRVQLRLNHTYTQPIIWNKLILRGAPVAVVDRGEAVAGSGSKQFSFEDNPYVSSADHGQQLAEMFLAYYDAARPVRTVKNLIYDENRYIGERGALTCADLGIADEVHVITAIRPKNGDLMDADVVPVGDLPQYANLYIWGQSYPVWNKQAIW